MSLKSSSLWVSTASIVPGAAMALLPKCPACAVAYLGLFSVFGVERWAPAYLWPVTYALLGLAVFLIAVRAKRRTDYVPLAVAVLGAAMLVVSHVSGGSTLLLMSGCALFIGGALWGARHRLSSRSAHCGEDATRRMVA